jgi:hypothetical protein
MWGQSGLPAHPRSLILRMPPPWGLYFTHNFPPHPILNSSWKILLLWPCDLHMFRLMVRFALCLWYDKRSQMQSWTSLQPCPRPHILGMCPPQPRALPSMNYPDASTYIIVSDQVLNLQTQSSHTFPRTFINPSFAYPNEMMMKPYQS